MNQNVFANASSHSLRVTGEIRFDCFLLLVQIFGPLVPLSSKKIHANILSLSERIINRIDKTVWSIIFHGKLIATLKKAIS